MWRGIVAIVALLLIVGSLVIIVPIMIIPNTSLHQLVPVLKPLHQAMACQAGETMEYEYDFFADGNRMYFRCVDAAGNERDVDGVLLTPAYYALGTLCLGGLLMLAPLAVAVRQGMRGETGVELQAVLKHSAEQMRQMPSAMSQGDAAALNTTALNASGKQQLEGLEKLRQQGLINQEAYEAAKKQIFDHFSA